MINENIEVRLTLADGTVLNNCECVLSGNILCCFLKNISFSDAYQYFKNDDKFNTVIYDLGFSDSFYDRITYSGFDDIVSIQKFEDGVINVLIVGPEIKMEEERIYTNGGE